MRACGVAHFVHDEDHDDDNDEILQHAYTNPVKKRGEDKNQPVYTPICKPPPIYKPGISL